LSERPHTDPADTPPDDFAELFEEAPVGYVVLSPGGRILRVNATLCRWLGRSAADLRGARFQELLTVAGRIFYETNFAPMLSISGAFEEVAIDLLSATGEKLPMLVNASERRGAADGATTIRVALLRARNRRGYEHDLRMHEEGARQRLADERQTAQLREQFIAVLGHDLRNPLASIAGAGRLLRREVQSDKALAIIQLMQSSVDLMAGLIDDVMDFARGRLGGGISVDRRPADIEPLLRRLVGELEAAHPGRVIDLHVEAGAPCLVDERRLGQLVSNLLANAITFGEPSSAIRLHARAAGDALQLTVSNQGPPIPDAAMKRLFEPFFRGEVRPSGQGLGLGLYIASEIAKSHGGELSVRSDAEGTSFTFLMQH
jgi:sigma-B regulation protein RsbU (phosphoserine phosphatase)